MNEPVCLTETRDGKGGSATGEGPSELEQKRSQEGHGDGWAASGGKEETGVYVRQTFDDA